MALPILKITHSEGDVFYAGATTDDDKLNGITNRINQTGLMVDSFTDSTEYQGVDTSYTNKISKTFTPGNSSNVLLGFKLVCSLKNDNSRNTDVRVNISDGTNTITTDDDSAASNNYQNVAGYMSIFETAGTYQVHTDVFWIPSYQAIGSTAGVEKGHITNKGLNPASAYTVTIDVKTDNADGDYFLDEVTFTMYWLDYGQTVATTKFS